MIKIKIFTYYLKYGIIISNMKKKVVTNLNKIPSKLDYYKKIIVEPAEKLLKALIEAETKEKEITKKSRRTAISR